MAYVKGTPPGPNAGDISPLTVALRPANRLTEEQCAHARQLRRDNPSLTDFDIAQLIGGGASEEDVRLALATIRTPNPNPTRATLNVTIEAAEFVAREAQHGEARWETVDRLFGELAQLRAVFAGFSSRSRAAS